MISIRARRLALFGIVSMLLAGAVTIGGYIPYQAAYSLAHPQRYPVTMKPKGIKGYQDVSFQTSDGLTLEGWYVPPKNGAVIIFVHGLGANRTIMLPEAHLFAQRGYGLLLFDLRNSGNSQGEITTLGALETLDVRAAVQFVRSQTNSITPLVLVGHSMGSAAVLLTAAEEPQVACVVTVSAFSDTRENVGEIVEGLTGLPAFPFGPLVIFWGQIQTGQNMHAVRPMDALPKINPRPILFVHGALDSVIPAYNSQRLYDAYTGPKEIHILPQAGHANFWDDPAQEFPRYLFQFVKGCVNLP